MVGAQQILAEARKESGAVLENHRGKGQRDLFKIWVDREKFSGSLNLQGTIPVRFVEAGISLGSEGGWVGEIRLKLKSILNVKTKSQSDSLQFGSRKRQSQHFLIYCDETESRDELNLYTVQANSSFRSRTRTRSWSVKKQVEVTNQKIFSTFCLIENEQVYIDKSIFR